MDIVDADTFENIICLFCVFFMITIALVVMSLVFQYQSEINSLYIQVTHWLTGFHEVPLMLE